eukprot:1728326-Pyramimonas_sp.AAC.1
MGAGKAVALQDIHGGERAMEEALQRIRCTSHTCWVSDSGVPRTGGVATLVPTGAHVRSTGKSFVAGR